jgi:pyruvate/2-oxoglutarate dehydrogenase complex dihydrolipoamide dehydrogenase (E3) component
VLNRYLQTTNRDIYAAGDVAGSYQLTHVAGWQGFVAARNALLPGRMSGLGPAVSWVVFTDPEVAQVGLAEHEARERYSKIAVHTWPMDRVDRAQTVGQTRGFLKIICRADDRVVGATLVGYGAGELINELSLAVQRKLTLADIAATIHAYPTAGFGLQQLSAEVTLKGLTSGWKGRLVRWLARRS